MDFNAKVLNPITTKNGDLRSYNDKGVKLSFNSVSKGHTFAGKLGNDGNGDCSYKGKWMGFDVTK